MLSKTYRLLCLTSLLACGYITYAEDKDSDVLDNIDTSDVINNPDISTPEQMEETPAQVDDSEKVINNLITDSPFLPPGFNKIDDTPILDPIIKPTPRPSPPTFEFKSYIKTSSGYSFSILDPKAKKSAWVNGFNPDLGVTVVNFDENANKLTIRTQTGQIQDLIIKESTIATGKEGSSYGQATGFPSSVSKPKLPVNSNTGGSGREPDDFERNIEEGFDIADTPIEDLSDEELKKELDKLLEELFKDLGMDDLK